MPPPNTPTNGAATPVSHISRPNTPPNNIFIFEGYDPATTHIGFAYYPPQSEVTQPVLHVPNNTPASSIHSSSENSYHSRSRRPTLLDRGIMEVIGEEERDRRDEDTLDYRAVDYVNPPDQNLICPICRVPLVDPVTIYCDHTFCRDCITQALAVTEKCPMDRYPISRNDPLRQSNRIIVQQVNDLMIVCPSCKTHLQRSKLRNHLAIHCKEVEIACLDPDCKQLIKRLHQPNGCLHYDSFCPYCDETLLQKDMEEHCESKCTFRRANCGQCGERILRIKESEHIDQCSEGIVKCQWSEFGCDHECKRKNIDDHKSKCELKRLGPWAAKMQADNKVKSEKIDRFERKIKHLENCISDNGTFDRADATAPSLAGLSMTDDSYETPNTYLLSVVESQQSRINALTASIAEMEARQSVMLLNETIPLKDQIVELRNTISTLNMYVRWLLNVRRGEGQRRSFGNGAGSSSGGGASTPDDNNGRAGPSSGGASIGRRLSDNNREGGTKL
ncbi:TRAF-type zinc finger [Botrytis cinerea]